jgi:hypothetical protein
MDIYKRVVYFCIGLCIVLVMGIINTLSMPNIEFNYFIMPQISSTTYSILCLLSYFCISILIAEGLNSKKLKNYLWSIGLVIVLNILWCFFFYRLHNTTISLVIMCILDLTCFLVLYKFTLTTRYVCLIALLLTIFYIYLTGLNLFVIIVN